MYKILSIFTVAGGLDIGFHRDFKYLNKYFKKLKFHTSVSLDINSDACKTIEADNKYFNNTIVLNKNIIEYDYKQIANNNYDVIRWFSMCYIQYC